MLQPINDVEAPLLGEPDAPAKSRSMYVGAWVCLFSCVLFIFGTVFFHPALVGIPWCYLTGVLAFLAGMVLFVIAAIPGTVKVVRDYLDGRPYEPAPRNWSQDVVDVVNSIAGIVFTAGTIMLLPQIEPAVDKFVNDLNFAGMGLYTLTTSWSTFVAFRMTPRCRPLIGMLLFYDFGMALFAAGMFTPATSQLTFWLLMAGSVFFTIGSAFTVYMTA
eukprot:TRINITY_DN6390_c1_g1_i1.p1 TRINITY_DN6390_c1_g1~~TRINITY_DN6390_c1_g1_i1.p1  ORF type:complete len:217 (+),score=44.73 TRINITY_DN6390_c1_g1_i1:61-711(+)